jgi:hypothetical protein
MTQPDILRFSLETDSLGEARRTKMKFMKGSGQITGMGTIHFPVSSYQDTYSTRRIDTKKAIYPDFKTSCVNTMVPDYEFIRRLHRRSGSALE